MSRELPIAISGDLGSGKTSVSLALADRLGIRRIGAGDLHRAIARELGISTLDLNRYAEKDPTVDDRVVQMLENIAASGEAVVADARLAWFFIPNSMKVHLVVSPDVGAERIILSRSGPVEQYSSPADARKSIAERSHRERERFKMLYGQDICRLRNYDMVIDSTAASVEEITDRICDVMRTIGNSPGTKPSLQHVKPRLLLAPKRIYPTRRMSGTDELLQSEVMKTPQYGFSIALEPIEVAYAHPYFLVLHGHRRLSAAIQRNLHHIPAVLVGEDGEPVEHGLTADEYLHSRNVRAFLAEWEAAHRLER